MKKSKSYLSIVNRRYNTQAYILVDGESFYLCDFFKGYEPVFTSLDDLDIYLSALIHIKDFSF